MPAHDAGGEADGVRVRADGDLIEQRFAEVFTARPAAGALAARRRRREHHGLPRVEPLDALSGGEDVPRALVAEGAEGHAGVPPAVRLQVRAAREGGPDADDDFAGARVGLGDIPQRELVRGPQDRLPHHHAPAPDPGGLTRRSRRRAPAGARAAALDGTRCGRRRATLRAGSWGPWDRAEPGTAGPSWDPRRDR